MSGLALAGRYAKALFELAQTSNSLDKVEADLNHLMKTVNSSAELASTLSNPVISKNVIEGILSALLKKLNASKLTINFINVLVQNGRTKYLAEVVSTYSSLMTHNRGEENAYITTASALNDNQIADIEKTLASTMGRKIRAITSINEEILGGMIVRIGSRMLDASLSGQLTKLNMLSKKAIANLN